MAKKLTMAGIRKSNALYEVKKQFELDEDNYVEIYPKFDPTKITDLITEMFTDGERAKESGIDFDSINSANWLLFNIVYKFADLGIPSDIKKKVECYHELIRYEYLDKIIAFFPDESLEMVTDRLKVITANLELLNEHNKIATTIEEIEVEQVDAVEEPIEFEKDEE